MAKDYVLKKYVRADSAGEAILLDDVSKVDEVFLLEAHKSSDTLQAVGFQVINPEDDD
jgi:hypothetical protein